MLFAIAKPISREQFLKLYRDISFLTKLLFAPFGVSDQTITVLGESEFAKIYTTTYQQLEDIVSKCVFRCHGLDDDRIIASMHKFVSQNQDSQVVNEIKSGADSIRTFANPDPVVMFDFPGYDYDEVLSSQTASTTLFNTIDALRELKTIIESSNNADTNRSMLKIDERIKNSFGITIGTRICNPIVELYNLSTLTPSMELSPTIEKLLNAFKIDAKSLNCFSPVVGSDSISLTYQQYIALLQLSTNAEDFTQKVIKYLQLPCDESNTGLNTLEALQCGKFLLDLNLFLHPTLSFLCQLTPLVSKNSDNLDESEDGETDCLRVRAYESMEFMLDALKKSDRAKELAEMERIDESIQLLSEDLLDLLDGSGKELNENDNDASESTVEYPIVPIFLQTTLLLQRAELYLESGDVELALDDIQSCIALEPLCGEAYSLRSQIIFSGLQQSQFSDSSDFDADSSPLSEILTESMKRESLDCLSELLPEPIVGSRNTEEQVGGLCAFHSSDILLHQAAEDALLAFILGGSNDIALAASAEEAARETCRKFAKSVYNHRHKEIMTAIQSTSYRTDKSFVSTEHFPHNWLIQTYFSGYELLSSALQVSDKPTLSEELKLVLNSKLTGGEFDIDEGEHEISCSKSLKLLPPDYLITHSDLNGYCVKEFDVEGYNLLFYIVTALETIALDGVSCEVTDNNSTTMIVSDEESDKDTLYNVVVSVDEREMDFSVDVDLVTCGKVEQNNFEGESSVSIKEQSILFATPKSDPLIEVDVRLHQSNEVPTCSFESSEFKTIVSLLRQSNHLTGVELYPNGFVEKFSFEFAGIEIPQEVRGDVKQASNRNKKGNKKGVEPSQLFYGGADDGEDYGCDSEEEAYEKMRDAFASHFGFANEYDEQNNEFEKDMYSNPDNYSSNMSQSKNDLSGIDKEHVDFVHNKNTEDIIDNEEEDDEDVWEDVSDESSHSLSDENEFMAAATVELVEPLVANDPKVEAFSSTFTNIISIEEKNKCLGRPGEIVNDIKLEDLMGREEVAHVDAEKDSEQFDPYLISRKIRARLLNVCGSVCYLCGDSIGAIKCFEASIFLDPSLSDSKIKMAALLIDMDEPHKADHLLKEVRNVDPANPVVYLHLGELAINGNSFEEAGTVLRQANRYMNMGWSSSSNIEVNEDKAKQCRALIHSSIYALLGVSMLRTNPHKPEFALHLLEEGLQLYPKSLMLLLCQGEIHAQCGDMIKAISLFSQVHKLKPSHPLALVNAGRTYQQLGQYRAAYEHISKSLEVDNTFAMSYIDLAQLLRLQPKLSNGNAETAIVAIEEAIPLSKQVSEIRDVLTARYVTLLQKALKNKGFINNNVI